jgi:CxxC-x17-CxxC domain-containing protein
LLKNFTIGLRIRRIPTRNGENIMADKELTCKECGKTFLFTEREQEFYKEKNFENEPQRCPECRSARKQALRGNRNNGPREMHTVICSGCGKETTVPFKPNGEKPVFCKECYEARKR